MTILWHLYWCDIHCEANNANDNGPSLFVFNVDMFAKPDNGEVKVIRINPIHWHNKMSDK